MAVLVVPGSLTNFDKFEQGVGILLGLVASPGEAETLAVFVRI